MSSLIQLASGGYWNSSSPEITKNELDIEVIAHSLSNLCRFTGHTREFYSVAQHSVLCSYIQTDFQDMFAYEKLMHDITESLLGDVSSPLKFSLPDYQRIELENERVVFKHFWCERILDNRIIKNIVKQADLIALVTEKRDLLPQNHLDASEWAKFDEIKPLDKKIVPWSSFKAKHAFLARFYEICPERFLEKKGRDALVFKHRMAFLFPILKYLAI